MDDIKKPEEQVNATQPELSQGELDKLAGGAVPFAEFSITMKMDAASPTLYKEATGGSTGTTTTTTTDTIVPAS